MWIYEGALGRLALYTKDQKNHTPGRKHLFEKLFSSKMRDKKEMSTQFWGRQIVTAIVLLFMFHLICVDKVGNEKNEFRENKQW